MFDAKTGFGMENFRKKFEKEINLLSRWKNR